MMTLYGAARVLGEGQHRGWLIENVNSLEAGHTKQPRELGCGDAYGRARHEAGNGGRWDELNEPTQAQQAHSKDDEAA